MTLVSIGVPVHNGAPHLDEALTALRRQSYEALEIIVCENASTDTSASIAAGHAAEDPRVVVAASSELLGAVANFNRAAELASGEFFMWAAHDDVFEPTFVETCLSALRGSDAVGCVSDAWIIDGYGHRTSRRVADPRFSSRVRRRRLRAHARAQDWLEVYALYRRDALPAQGPMRAGVPGPDVVLTWELLQQGRLLVLPVPLWSYRREGASYKTALESFSSLAVDGGRRALSGLNARLWVEMWRRASGGAGGRRAAARLELLCALVSMPWLRRFRDDLRAEVLLRRPCR